jgi:3-keto-5-aminohexanoate cleavage enzyme
MTQIRKAHEQDRDSILGVMEPWNMHHVPSEEMEELDISCFFVATIDEKIVGASGYKLISHLQGKTTLLGVLPEYSGKGIGKLLQDARLEAMYELGAKIVITNADRPSAIKWYKKHYGYYQIGSLKKIHSFGDDSIDSWTTLEMDLNKYMENRSKQSTEGFVERNQPHPLAPYPPLLINVCLTGMIPTKEMTEFVPITPEEIAEQAVAVYDKGARIVHLHARDQNGKPTWKAEIYEKMITLIRRERPGLICCISTSGRNWPEFEKRSEALHITGAGKPDMASLTLGSLNFPTGPSINSIEMVSKLAVAMKQTGVKPELEVFDPGMISLAKVLETKGILEGRKYFNLLFGSLNSIPARLKDLDYLISTLPEKSVWAAAGIGQFQLPINAGAIIMGGNVRVGLEDNIFYDYKKKKLATNVELVERLIRIANEIYRPIATPEEARILVGLN